MVQKIPRAGASKLAGVTRLLYRFEDVKWSWEKFSRIAASAAEVSYEKNKNSPVQSIQTPDAMLLQQRLEFDPEKRAKLIKLDIQKEMASLMPAIPARGRRPGLSCAGSRARVDRTPVCAHTGPVAAAREHNERQIGCEQDC